MQRSLVVSALPHHCGRSLPQLLASAATDFSNPVLATVTQGRVGGSEGDIETKGGGGVCKSVTELE